MRNQFLGFANQIIAQHTQGGGPFDSAAMIFPEAAEQAAGETVQNSYVTNRYRIQRITEENYLYQQNFQLLNQLYEKQTFRNFYPTVEKQVEKLISREMPELEEKLTVRMAQEIHRLVREGGTEQLTVLKERLEKTERETLEKELRRERTHTERLEKELWREQTHTERIGRSCGLRFRKIGSIRNGSGRSFRENDSTRSRQKENRFIQSRRGQKRSFRRCLYTQNP